MFSVVVFVFARGVDEKNYIVLIPLPSLIKKLFLFVHSNAGDGCWSHDQLGIGASLRSGSGPPLSYASVTAGRVSRMGHGTGHGPVPRTTKKMDPKPALVSAPRAKKDRTALAVADLFARLADVTGGNRETG